MVQDAGSKLGGLIDIVVGALYQTARPKCRETESIIFVSRKIDDIVNCIDGWVRIDKQRRGKMMIEKEQPQQEPQEKEDKKEENYLTDMIDSAGEILTSVADILDGVQ